MDIEIMIRMIWLLYRRAKWKYLADLGLDRSTVEPVFHDFDMRHVVNESGLITSKAQTKRLVKMCPGLINAAVKLQSAYVERSYRD